MIYKFYPDYVIHRNQVSQAHKDEIIGEPMLFSASPLFAYRNGGPVTRRILDSLPSDAFDPQYGRSMVIDTRLHMLMPGMYPAIPGWHCDAWPRGDEGQPDPDEANIELGVRHWVCVLGTPSLTEFVDEDLTIAIDPRSVWKSVSSSIDTVENLETFQVGSGDVAEFGIDQLHRARPADRHGWRFFFRLSHYQYEAQNKIRKQVQVYTTEHGGW